MPDPTRSPTTTSWGWSSRSGSTSTSASKPLSMRSPNIVGHRHSRQTRRCGRGPGGRGHRLCQLFRLAHRFSTDHPQRTSLLRCPVDLPHVDGMRISVFLIDTGPGQIASQAAGLAPRHRHHLASKPDPPSQSYRTREPALPRLERKPGMAADRACDDETGRKL